MESDWERKEADLTERWEKTNRLGGRRGGWSWLVYSGIFALIVFALWHGFKYGWIQKITRFIFG